MKKTTWDDFDSLVVSASEINNMVTNMNYSVAQEIKPHYINHFISYGQSLSMGAVSGTILSNTQPYKNVTFSGGVSAGTRGTQFLPIKPLVEVSGALYGESFGGETPCSAMANTYCKLLEDDGLNPNSYKILSTAAGHGSYSLAQLQKGSTWYSVLIAHITNAYNISSSYQLQLIHWAQGENDSTTLYQDYYDRLSALFDDIQSDYEDITGNTNKIFFSIYQCYGYATTTNDRAVSTAQLELARNKDVVLLSSPVYHLPISAFPHLTSEGYYTLGAYASKSFYRAVKHNDTRLPIYPINITKSGKFVTINFEVLNAPLMFNTVDISSKADYGFVVKNNNVVVDILSLAISSDGYSVIIETDTELDSTCQVRYGLDSTIGGNLIDSQDDIIDIPNSGQKTLFNVCPMFKL